MTPTVTTIIPTYNHAESLSDAIESVRMQRWPELEMIVVDDGSVDHTREVVDRLSGADLRYIRQENRGPAAARNAGIGMAQGEWIAFLDADDYWLPGKLSVQFDAIRQEPLVGFCYGNVILRDANGTERQSRLPAPTRSLLWELLAGNRLATPTVMIRRDCLETVGLFNTDLRTGEDWDLWLRVSARAVCVGVGRPLALVRRTTGPKTYSLKVLERCTLLVLEKLYSRAEIVELWPELMAERKRIYSWQYSVLAKSYLAHAEPIDFGRLALRAMLSHYLGTFYLLSRGRMPTFGPEGFRQANCSIQKGRRSRTV